MEIWECGMEFLVDGGGEEKEGGRKGTGARIKQKTTHIGSGTKTILSENLPASKFLQRGGLGEAHLD